MDHPNFHTRKSNVPQLPVDQLRTTDHKNGIHRNGSMTLSRTAKTFDEFFSCPYCKNSICERVVTTCNVNDVKTFFEHFFNYYRLFPHEVIAYLLSFFDAKSILLLRLISKEFLNFVSTKFCTNDKLNLSILSRKAAISCPYSLIFPRVDQSVSSKVDFARKEELENHVAVHVSDFESIEPSFYTFLDNKKIIIEINSLDELKAFEDLVGHDCNETLTSINTDLEINCSDFETIGCLHKKLSENPLEDRFLKFKNKNNLKEDAFTEYIKNLKISIKKIELILNIKELNFEKAELNAEGENFHPIPTYSILSYTNFYEGGYSYNDPTFKKLTTIKLGNIEKGLTWLMSDAYFTLKNLSVGNIEDQGTLKLSSSCSNITNLTLKDINSKKIIRQIAKLQKLEDLSLGTIKVDFELPYSLSSLCTLNIGDIEENVTLTIPSSYTKLKSLSIGTFLNASNLEIKSLLPSVAMLSLESIYSDITLQPFLQFPNLNSLFIRNVFSRINSDNLLCEFKSLRDLSIQNIRKENCLHLLNPVDIISFSIHTICTDSTLNMQGIYPNLTNIYLGCMQKDSGMLLLGSFPKLTTLFINNLQANSNFTLSKADYLANLTIKNITAKSTLKLPSILPHLYSLTIENVERNVINSLSSASWQGLRKLSINGHEAIRTNTKFIMSKSCDMNTLNLLKIINSGIHTSLDLRNTRSQDEKCICQ